MTEQTAAWTGEAVSDGAFVPLRDALMSAVGRIVAHLPAIPRDDHPEHVHQVRVGQRRMRTIVGGFRPLLDDDWVDEVTSRTRTLCRGLSRLRDADILLARLRSDAEKLRDPSDAASLVATVERHHKRARERVVGQLSSSDMLHEVSALASIAAEVGPRRGTAPLEGAVLGLAAVAWHDLRASVEVAGVSPSVEVLHQLRIKTKHARYLGDAVAPIVGDDVRRFVDAAADFQTVLGSIQDAAITIGRLETYSREGGKRRASGARQNRAFVAGQLAQIETEQLAKAISKWPVAWDRVLGSAS